MSDRVEPVPSTSKLPAAAAAASTSSSNRAPAAGTKRRSSRYEPDSLQYALVSGFAGGVAGCVAKTSVAPLDRVKILFQTKSPEYSRYAGTWLGVFRASQDIYSETGIRGLLQGHSATLLRIFPYAAIKFMAYEKFHVVLMPTPDRETSGRRFLAGSLAGVTSAMITYPLELIRVRLAFEPRHSLSDRASITRTIRQIYREPVVPPFASPSTSTPAPAPTLPTLTHFYRGVMPTIVGIVPYAGTSFLIWGFLKHDLFPTYFSSAFRARNRTSLDLLAGGLAGAIGQTSAYPLDIIRRRMQVGPVLTPGVRAGFWETAKSVHATSGWRGFFVGLSIGYLKVVPMNAVSFATWVGLKEVLGLDAHEQ